RGDDLRAAERWLAEAGTDKERQPTPPPNEYIIASRKASERQRVFLGAVATGAVIAIVLVIITWKHLDAARRTSAQADFDLAVMYQREADLAEPKALAHLARSLRTRPEAH